MKLNNGGYDQETTLEFFNSHIIPVDLLARYTKFRGVRRLEFCGKKLEKKIIEHVDTYLRDDKSSWRVQLRVKYPVSSIEEYWSTISNFINKYSRHYTDKETGELIWTECNYSGFSITYTFNIPYIEEVPEFSSPKERREWAKAILQP